MALSTFTGAARQLLARELIEHAGKPHRANGMGDYAEATVALRITVAGLAAIGIETEPASATQA
jgi:hypothetical protein